MKKLLGAMAVVVWMVVASRYFTNYKRAVFQVDEYWFTSKTFYYDLFFVKHDLTDERWYLVGEPAQPKFGVYVYGLTLHLTGVSDIQSKLADIKFDEQSKGVKPWWEEWWNKDPTLAPEELKNKFELIFKERLVAIGFSVVALAAVGILAWQVSPIWSLLAIMLLGTNGLMWYSGRVAMTDSMQLAGFYVGLIGVFWLMKQIQKRNKLNVFWLSGSLGLVICFTSGVKVIGILELLLVLGVLGTSGVLNWMKNKKIDLEPLSCLTILVFFLLPFIFFQPYLYHRTGNHLWFMFVQRIDDAKYSWQLRSGSAVTSKTEAVKLMWSKSVGLKPIYGNWPDSNLPIDMVLYLGGIGVMLKNSWSVLVKKKHLNLEAMLLLWHLVVMSSLVFYLKNNWSRYFLPLESTITLVQAYFLAWLVSWLKPFSLADPA